MTKSDSADVLRHAAEAFLDASAEKNAAMAPSTDLSRLVHELQVHQIELEMQNEELRRSQLELVAQRSDYFDLYDLAPVGYCTLSAQGLMMQVNLTFASLLGSERRDLINQAFSRLVLKADTNIHKLYFQQLPENPGPSTCELRLVKQDGTSFWANLTTTIGHRSDGVTVHRVTISDISERKRAEEELRQQNELFYLITANISDFIAVLDRDGRRLYNSPSYVEFFGATRGFLGSDSFAEVHPEDRERVRRIFHETVQTGLGRQTDYRFVIADGSIHEMESRGSVIKDSEGKVTRVVVVAHDVTERKHLEEQVRQLAFHDTLTRLPNRRLLNDRLSQSMAASTRSAYHGAVMFLDLDNFKQLNDTHGHAVGDLLLTEVAERLKSSVRETDTVARFGGDEFVVMISELSVDRGDSVAEAEIVAEKIRTALSKPYHLLIRNKGKAEKTIEHHCTASIGVALFINQEASQDDVLSWADAAMYRAKDAGRNSIRFCNTSA